MNNMDPAWAYAKQLSTDIFNKKAKKDAEKALDAKGGASGKPEGDLASLAADTIFDNTQNQISARQSAIQGTAAKAGDVLGTAFFGPAAGKAIGNIMKTAYALSNASGLTGADMTLDQAEAIGANKTTSLINEFQAAVPFAGAAGTTTKDALQSKEMREVADAVAGAKADSDMAQSLGGNRYLAGAKKANDFITEQNKVNDQVTKLAQVNTLRAKNGYAPSLAAYSGSTPQASLFKEGGKIGLDTNILPEGALHAHRNNLEDVNEELGSQVTEKGIPVVVVKEGGELQQVAEIEHSEWTACLATTEKMEELWKKVKEAETDKEKDELLVKLGKFLTDELINNTEDPNNMLGDKEE